MSAEETERATVRTYVPQYQKDRWAEHAEQLDMSQSEFVRTMVQAGRRDFELGESEEPPEEGSSGPDPRGVDMEDRVVRTLRRDGPLGWEALLESVADSIEDRLESTLDDLQRADRIRYSGRDGGYVLLE